MTLPHHEDSSIVLDKLKVALGLVETLRQENEAYKDNFEQLKSSYTILREQNEATTKALELNEREKISFEQELNDSLNYLKGQLESKSKEVEELKPKVAGPDDLELIRLKCLEEFDKASRKKWKTVEEETEKFRTLYFKVRREFETLKSENERLKREESAKLTEIARNHTEELSLMESKVLALQSSLDGLSDTERVRNYQRENTELQIKVASLISELEEVRSAKESLSVEYEQQERLHNRNILEEIANGKQLQADNNSLRAKVSSMEHEIKQLIYQTEKISEENSVLEKEVHLQRSKSEEISHKSNVELSDLKVDFLKEKSELNNLINDLRKNIGDQQSEMKNMDETITDLRSRLSNADREYLVKLRASREEEWVKISRLETEKNELEQQVASLKLLQSEVESREEAFRKEVNTELSKMKKQWSEATTENGDLVAKNQTLTNVNDKLEGKLADLQAKLADSEGKSIALAKENDDKIRQELALKDKIVASETLVKSVQDELLQVNDHLQKEMEAYQHNIDRYRSIWNKEKLQIQQELQNTKLEAERLAERNKEIEEVFEKQQDVFKSKIVQLKSKAKEYKTESDALRKSLESESEKSRSYSLQMRQKQSEFLKLIQMESL